MAGPCVLNSNSTRTRSIPFLEGRRISPKSPKRRRWRPSRRRRRLCRRHRRARRRRRRREQAGRGTLSPRTRANRKSYETTKMFVCRFLTTFFRRREYLRAFSYLGAVRAPSRRRRPRLWRRARRRLRRRRARTPQRPCTSGQTPRTRPRTRTLSSTPRGQPSPESHASPPETCEDATQHPNPNPTPAPAPTRVPTTRAKRGAPPWRPP
mmetsp:Transcript_2056/g.8113  ORF Transcript_2056/g.8113 Transcript_2056/m.8113 type:complete len:209 (-) Transcript_2056:2304-2930(-)